MKFILFLIAILILLSINYGQFAENFENSVKLNYTTDAKCPYKMVNVLSNTMNKLHINKVNDPDNIKSWDIYLPCSYNTANSELSSLSQAKGKKIYIIDGCDNLARKDGVWESLKTYYGDKAVNYMPRTWITYKAEDIANFKNSFNPRLVYIMKKNIQQQTGLKISNNLNEILELKDEGYVVIQEMLQNPFLIENRKTNCRIYLLITCQNGQKSGYIFNDGFMYYTPDYFQKYSKDFKKVITSGYIDRAVYQRNPLTLQDFQKYLDTNGYGVQIFPALKDLFNAILKACMNTYCKTDLSKNQNNILFQLFGCDIAFNDNLVPQLIEINKGPDLGAKDGRDGKLKQQLSDDIFKIIGVYDTNMDGFTNSNFIRVI